MYWARNDLFFDEKHKMCTQGTYTAVYLGRVLHWEAYTGVYGSRVSHWGGKWNSSQIHGSDTRPCIMTVYPTLGWIPRVFRFQNLFLSFPSLITWYPESPICYITCKKLEKHKTQHNITQHITTQHNTAQPPTRAPPTSIPTRKTLLIHITT